MTTERGRKSARKVRPKIKTLTASAVARRKRKRRLRRKMETMMSK